MAQNVWLSRLSKELAESKIEIEKQKVTISDCLEQNESNSDILNKESDLLKIKVRWLNATISNVKDKFSDCKTMLAMRDITINALRQSLNVTRQRCSGIVSESNQCQYKLTENRYENEQLRVALELSRSNRDVTKSCIARGDHLLALHQNAIQELSNERESLVCTIRNQNYTHLQETEILNYKLSLVCRNLL